MDSTKLCFITCVSNERSYEECVFYINHLNIPSGFSIEILGLRDVLCQSVGYNMALEKTNAKYKVYIDEDTLIINKNFIFDILELFNKNKSIGMIGIAGIKKLPTSGEWWELEESRVVNIYSTLFGSMAVLNENLIEGDYEIVEAIDGMMMATQYDVKWRDDIFDGVYFYDTSQSMEFKREKYEVAIPNMKKAWCTYTGDKIERTESYENYRKKFIKEYEKELYSNLPIVSILMPAYNQTIFFEQALKSALNQTYKKIEIIIGDDSTTNDVENLVKSYMKYHDNIKYIKNPKPLGGSGIRNSENLVNLANGSYISFLFHDDLYSETRIEKMMSYLINDESLVLATSSFNYINENSDVVRTHSIFPEKDIKMLGEDVIKETLTKLENFIGAPSMVVFKNILQDKEILTLEGKYIHALGDVVAWIKLLQRGNMIYLHEVLSSFRTSDQQNSNNLFIISGSAPDWYNIIEYCYNNKLFIKCQKQLDELKASWYQKNFYLIELFYKHMSSKNNFNEYNILKYDMDKLLEECNMVVENKS